MIKLAKYIENEFERNSWFFAQAESSMMAACDFIELVILDKNLVNLTEEDRRYIEKIRSTYLRLQTLTKEMKEEIQNFKEAFQQTFC